MKRSRICLFFFLVASLVGPTAVAAQDVPEGSPEAVAEFAQAMKLYMDTKYEEAARHFLRAQEIDPSFVVAWFYAGLMQRDLGNLSRADSLFALADAQKDRLSFYYQERLATSLALNEMDAAAALERARALAAKAPGTKAVYNYGFYAMRMNRPREAIAAFKNLDRTREPMKSWGPYWGNLASAQHMIGDYEGALETVEDRIRHFATPMHVQRAWALSALGRVEETRAALDAATAESPSSGWNNLSYVAAIWGEFDAHGQADAATQIRSDFLRDHADLARGGSASDRSWYAWALYGHGRDEEAARLYQELAEKDPNSAQYIGMTGVLAARRGDAAAAREIDGRLAEMDRADPRGGAVGSRASIAAALGDGATALAHLREYMGRGLAEVTPGLGPVTP